MWCYPGYTYNHFAALFSLFSHYFRFLISIFYGNENNTSALVACFFFFFRVATFNMILFHSHDVRSPITSKNEFIAKLESTNTYQILMWECETKSWTKNCRFFAFFACRNPPNGTTHWLSLT